VFGTLPRAAVRRRRRRRPKPFPQHAVGTASGACAPLASSGAKRDSIRYLRMCIRISCRQRGQRTAVTTSGLLQPRRRGRLGGRRTISPHRSPRRSRRRCAMPVHGRRRGLHAQERVDRGLTDACVVQCPQRRGVARCVDRRRAAASRRFRGRRGAVPYRNLRRWRSSTFHAVWSPGRRRLRPCVGPAREGNAARVAAGALVHTGAASTSRVGRPLALLAATPARGLDG
jgi:hypothetical protein